MKPQSDYDVIVIGAGPAGASSAYHLAQKGWRVALFEKSRMPREKACGDGLGTGSLDMLRTMQVGLALESFQSVDGVDVKVNGQSTCGRSFQSPAGPSFGMVVPRSELDLMVANRAREAGSVWYEGCRVTGFEFERGRISGISYVNGSYSTARARFVVIADGGSGLSKQAGVPPRPAETTGYAIRGYFENAPDCSNLFNIYLPLSDPSSGRAVPGYGWVFPLKNSRANIGVGYYPCQRQDRTLNLRHLFGHFLEYLASVEPGMAHLRLVGKWIGGPLRSGMDPARCAANGALVVGDAAGLVDPFTGEGIDTALVSGEFAAEALNTALKRDDPDCLEEYGELLRERYSDRFQLGERFVKTYSFIWKLVQTTVDQKGLLFDRVRQSLFNYQGSDQKPMALMPASKLDRFTTQVTVEMKKIAAEDFPVFARIALRLHDEPSAKLRQTLAFWCAHLGGGEPEQSAVVVAACLELAKLAHSVQSDVIPGESGAASGNASNHWANSFAVMCGNYLLTKTFAAMLPLGHEMTQLVASAATELCRAEIERSAGAQKPARDENVRVAAEIDGLFCGMACKIASRLAGSPENVQERLERFGRLLGEAASWGRQSQRSQLAGMASEQAEQSLFDIHDCPAKAELMSLSRGIFYPTQPVQ